MIIEYMVVSNQKMNEVSQEYNMQLIILPNIIVQ